MADKSDIDPVRRGLGMRLASARQNKGFTQQDIATRFSLNKATVSAWETGRGVPDALTLRDVAKLYDVSADSLLWEDSLSPEAMKFAAAFDGLSEQQKRTLNAIWMAYIQESASDLTVEDRMAATKEFKYNKNVATEPSSPTGQQGRGMSGNVQMIGNVSPPKGAKHGKSDSDPRVPDKKHSRNS